MVIAHPLIVERSAKPARHKMTQVDLAVVFEFVDDVANDPAAAVCGDSCVKMNRAMRTIRAAKRRVDRAFERL